MFSAAEKKKISEAIEKVLLEINHPEMPKEKPVFKLHVDGKESCSWADIEPNWIFNKDNVPVPHNGMKTLVGLWLEVNRATSGNNAKR